jgi:hypothetical protein
VWKYNFPVHFQASHPSVGVEPYEHLWEMTDIEEKRMKLAWTNRRMVKVTKQTKGKHPPTSPAN